MPTSLGDSNEYDRAVSNLRMAQFASSIQKKNNAEDPSRPKPLSVNENLTSMAGQLSKPDTTKTTKVSAGFGTRNEGQVTKSGSTGRPWSKRTEESSESPAQSWYGKGTKAKKAPSRKPKTAKRGKK